jgi:hypothetical protein
MLVGVDLGVFCRLSCTLASRIAHVLCVASCRVAYAMMPSLQWAVFEAWGCLLQHAVESMLP